MHAAFYDQFARIGKAIASPGRLHLLDVLAQGSRTVEELANESGLTVANTSQHLRVLAQAHLVAFDKRGLHVHYRIAGPAVESLLSCLQRTASVQLADVARLTVIDVEQDRAVLREHGAIALRQSKLMRIAEEAREHGGALTQEDLGVLLCCNERTIRRDIKVLHAMGIHVPTRV